MASNTENLDLLMKNPSTDGADTFNVQTMLNENWQKIDNNAGTVAQTLANILKPTTPPLIGLPPSTTPDGMFQALGNTGELHVWRKTVVTAAEIPAGYTLGSAEANVVIAEINNGYGNYEVTITYGTSVHVSDAGIASSSGTTSFNTLGILTWGDGSNRVNTLRGKFCKVSSGQGTVESRLFYVPNNATLTYKTVGVNNQLILSSLQPVNPYPLTPAGTTTTYPVSTNPNAYQEWDDAKEAGYTLGDMVTGMFRINAVYNNTTIYYASSVNVADNGAVTLANQATQGLAAEEDSYNNAKKLAGKFIIADYDHNYCKIPKGVVLFIPANTTISFRQDVPGDEGYGIFFDRYQPVTGYAAIPAGTTIEYLGKLGDKARVQVVSYVGTGTYGKDNPCSISVDFPMKAIVFLARISTINGNKQALPYFSNSSYANDVSMVPVGQMPTTYAQFFGLGSNYGSSNFGRRSQDCKSYYWYSVDSSGSQGNLANGTYYFLVIG